MSGAGTSILSVDTVALGSTASTKQAAIAEVAALLAAAGNIDPAYGRSMLGREKVANTFLGGGIAIPHGLLKDREMILRTGIAVVQVPAGVEWNPGEPVRIVVGIAAASDDHLSILANLTRILADDEAIEELATTTDPDVVVRRLTAPAGRPPSSVGSAPDLVGYTSTEVVIDLAHGLHARPATVFVDVAKGFEADVRVRHRDEVANGKAMASLLGLGVEGGASVTLLAKGIDAEEALAALTAAVGAGLGEGDEAEESDAAPVDAIAWAPTGAALSVRGLPASPGIAIGPLWHLTRTKLVVEKVGRDAVVEEQRLTGAIERARAELRELHDSIAARSGRGKAAIMKAHEAFLDDPDLVEETVRSIRAGSSAGWAWRDVIAGRVAVLGRVDDPMLAARATDLDDVGNRVLRWLAATDGTAPEDGPALPDHPVILLADDLTPSDTAAIDPTRVIGFCTAVGGPTSHTAIIARALGIPAIVGAGPAVLAPADGAVAVLDGGAGALWLELEESDLASAQGAQRGIERLRAEEHQARFRPAITVDGERVEVVANVNRAGDAAVAVEAGAEGVGLMRTEFMFLGRDEPPSEDEQYEVLAEMVRSLNGLPLVVRTLDIGGDKNVPYLDLPHEDNTFLGIRGIRLCFERPDLFAPQLRAIYRASKLGPVSMMFPMIARIEDLDAAMLHAEIARSEVGAEPIDIGVMIEVPSAALIAPELAKKVQFFSIGTNDLTQYTLAMDRLHPMLAAQADALHPAVLRLIRMVVDAARPEDVWVGVCGGIAGDPEGALILSGLGVDELSMSIPSVAAVKARLRNVSMADARRLAERALACSTADDVRALL